MKFSKLFVAIFFLIAVILALTTAAEKCAVTLSKTQGSTLSPNTGLVLWPGSKASGAFKPAISLEYSYFAPSDVAISQSPTGIITYDWSKVEDFLETCKTNSHAGIIRFYYVYPDETPGVTVQTTVPSFIKSTAGYKESSQKYGNPDAPSTLKLPDWSSAALQVFHKQFYRDLATKFDNDPRLAYLQVGFGHWGEYHLYSEAEDDSVVLGINFPSKTFQAEFLTVLKQSFLHTPFSMSIDAASSTYSPFKASPPDTIPIGLFDDSFMHKNHEKTSGDGYNEQCWVDLKWFDETNPRWKLGPAGGEVSYYTSGDQHNFLDDDGMYGMKFSEQSTKYKLTYLLANDAPDVAKNTPAKFQQAATTMGYRFVVQSIAFNHADRTATVVIKNSGVAPPYHDHYVNISWGSGVNDKSTSATSLKLLLPEATATVILTDVDFTALGAVITGGSTSWFTVSSTKATVTTPYTIDCSYDASMVTETPSDDQDNSDLAHFNAPLILWTMVMFFLMTA